MAIFTAAEALEIAMEIERNGQVFYSAVAAKASDPELRALFVELARQEQAHYAVFQKMAGTLTETPGLPAAEYDQYQPYLQATLDSALFSGPDKALAAAQQAGDRAAALRVAIGFEKDTLLFFYDLHEMVSPAEQAAIDGIIREEKKHLRRLAKLL